MLLALISLGAASVNLVGVSVKRDLSATEIPWGEASQVTLTLKNEKSLSAFWLFWEDHVDQGLDIEGPKSHLKSLKPSQIHKLKFRIHSTRRGFFKVGPTVVESSGPFGLVRRYLLGSQVDFLTVLPRVVPVEKGLAQGRRPVHQIPRRHSIFEDPSRFMGVREYQPGDSLRRIHWKATARSAAIQVKLFEPSVLLGALLAVDMFQDSFPVNSNEDGNTGDPLLELAITAAASLAEYILSGDQQVGLLSNGEDAAEQYQEDWKGGIFRRLDQALESSRSANKQSRFEPLELAPGKGRRQLERLHSALARLIPTEHFSLPELLMSELPRLPRSLVCVIITPILDRALDNALGSLRRSGIEVVVIWIQSDAEPHKPQISVSYNLPVYIVRNDQDLIRLGARSL
jgi:uncharacterized protein (DUF58 family)